MSLYQFTYLPYEKQRLLDFKSQGHIDYTYINVLYINIYFSIAYYQIDLFSKKTTHPVCLDSLDICLTPQIDTIQ